MATQQEITDILRKVIYPNFQKDIVTFGFVKEVEVSNKDVKIRVDIPSSAQEVIEKLRQEISQKLESVLQGATLQLEINSPKPAPQPQPKTKNLGHVNKLRGKINEKTAFAPYRAPYFSHKFTLYATFYNAGCAAYMEQITGWR